MGSILFGRLLFYNPLMEKTLTEEDKNTSAQWAKMHALFLEVMEELKTSKNLKVCFFFLYIIEMGGFERWPVDWPYSQVDGQWKTGQLKDSCMCHSLVKMTGNLRSTLKNFVPKSEGNLNQQVDFLVCLFVVATWFIKWVNME